MIERSHTARRSFSYIFSLVVIVTLVYQLQNTFDHSSTITRFVSVPEIKNWSYFIYGHSNQRKSSNLSHLFLPDSVSSQQFDTQNSSNLPDKFLENYVGSDEQNNNDNIEVLNCSQIHNLLLKHGFAESGCSGRLGNQLGVIAIGLAVNLQFGSKLVLSQIQTGRLSCALDMDSICKKDGSSFCITLPKDCKVPAVSRGKTISTSRESLWKKGLLSIGETPGDAEGKKIKLPFYPQFLPWIMATYYSEFRSRITFREDVWTEAKMVLDYLNKIHNCHPTQDCTAVFVHMRMGDYSKHMTALGWGPNVFHETNYMQEAFKHVTNSYKKPVFYVLGHTNEDVEAFFKSQEEDFRGMKVVIVASFQKELFKFNDQKDKDFIGIDLALMAMSDVLVLSYGSYGDFGALFGKDKQQVLYPKDHKTHDETGVNLGLPRFVPIAWTKRNVTNK